MVRQLGSAVGALGIAGGVAVLAIRQAAWTHRAGMAISAATPYLAVFPVAGTVLAAVCRNRWVTGVGVVTVALFAATQLPLYVGGPGVTGPDAPLRVLTSNMRYGFADAEALVAEVRNRHVDVLALQEMTPDAVDDLRNAGIGELLPFELLQPAWGVSGTGLFSRFPVSEHDTPDQETPPTVATLAFEANGATVVLTIASVHPRSPWPSSTPQWSAQLGELAEWADGLDGPVVIAGDFNATNDHKQMRRFYAEGYIDSTEHAGGGYLATYPANRRYPPFIAIDHVLTRGGPVATHVTSITIPGTDHRAIMATVAVPIPADAAAGG
jgi:endonuclease/exonuclease/phosphatase (EEP) superfamily protein YafD